MLDPALWTMRIIPQSTPSNRRGALLPAGVAIVGNIERPPPRNNASRTNRDTGRSDQTTRQNPRLSSLAFWDEPCYRARAVQIRTAWVAHPAGSWLSAGCIMQALKRTSVGGVRGGLRE